MPLGTLDRTPPPFFRQGPSALTRLIVFASLSVFLMAADTRLGLTGPLRAIAAVILHPIERVLLAPVRGALSAGLYVDGIAQAQARADQARAELTRQSERSVQAGQLQQENARLRALLELRERLSLRARAAEVLYDAPDPYTRKIIVDQGLLQGIEAGSPVVDESGVVGQVTRVYPLVSEVSLVIDRDHAIPVLNTRTGARSVAFGDPVTQGGALELPFMPANADVVEGDVLTTSGVDGVYLPGLPVGRIAKVERRADSSFARIHAQPVALAAGTRHVMILKPSSAMIPPPPAEEKTAQPARRKGRP